VADDTARVTRVARVLQQLCWWRAQVANHLRV